MSAIGYSGRSLQIHIDSELVAAVRQKSASLARSSIDNTHEFGDGWQHFLGPEDHRSYQISVSGVATSANYAKLVALWSGDIFADLEVVHPDGASWDGDAFLTGLTFGGESGGYVSFDAALTLSGTVTTTFSGNLVGAADEAHGGGAGASGIVAPGSVLAATVEEVPTDLIFLRGVGEWHIDTVDGTEVNIDLPTREAGDDLFVFVNSMFEQTLAPTGWTKVKEITVTGIVGAVRLFHRVATNDGDDNFFIPANGSIRNQVAQMAAFGNTDPGSPPDFLVEIQAGGTTNEGGTPLNYLSMSAGPDATDTFVLFLATHYRLSTSGAVFTPANENDDLREIDSLAVDGPSDDNGRINITWSWDFQATSVSVPGGTIDYTTQEFGSNFSQYSRWNLQ